MKELTNHQLSQVTGSASSMSNAEWCESWSRTFGLLSSMGGSVVGGFAGVLLLDKRNVIQSGVIGFVGGGVACYLAAYVSSKVLLNHIYLV